MRILHVGKYYSPVRGGMETVLRHLCEGLLERGHEVTALVAGGDVGDFSEPLGPTACGATGRLVRAGAVAVLNSQPVTPTLPILLHRELSRLRPDVVHLHLPNPGACAACLAMLPRRRRVGTVPRFAVWYHADITRQRFGEFLVRPLVAACLNRAAGISVSSTALRRHSPRLSRWRDKVTVIPFGIALEEWESVHSGATGPFLFVGRLVYYKGLSLLLQAIGRVPGAELVIVGSGPLLRNLMEQVERDSLYDRVKFVGELSDTQLRHTMSTTRALILPSVLQSETFGLVQLEAMAAGLPVISTALPTGVAEVNLDGETGRVVTPADVDALTTALVELQNDTALARKWGESGRRRVRERFTREIMVARLEEWYASLLKAES